MIQRHTELISKGLSRVLTSITHTRTLAGTLADRRTGTKIHICRYTDRLTIKGVHRGDLIPG